MGQIPSLRDLIYIDQKRLNSYARQIEPGGAVVKVPKWTIGISLTGPKVSGEQNQSFRPREAEEKIDLLLKHLKKNSELADGRIREANYFGSPPVFRYEKDCTVVGVDVPLTSTEPSAGTVRLWVSRDPPGETGRLFLLQDFHKSDEDAFDAESAYRSLHLIYEELISKAEKYQESFVSSVRNQERKRLQTSRRALKNSRGFLDPELDEIEVDGRVQNRMKAYFPLRDPLEEEFQKRFAVDPVGTLEEMGAKVFGERAVETLYRVRKVHMEPVPTASQLLVVTFAYPIFMSAV